MKWLKLEGDGFVIKLKGEWIIASDNVKEIWKNVLWIDVRYIYIKKFEEINFSSLFQKENFSLKNCDPKRK